MQSNARRWASQCFPVFFDRHTKDLMPFADILDWDDLSITIDAVGMMARGENAIDLLNARFDLDRALQISQQASHCYQRFRPPPRVQKV